MNPHAIEKKSLVDRVLAALETSILKGFYKDFLPGERTLGKELGVSRFVVRQALQVMSERGVIEIAQGRRARILHKLEFTRRNKLHTVATLHKSSIENISHSTSLILLHLQKHLFAAGYSINMHFKPSTSFGPPTRIVRQLVDNNPADCWVLFSGNPHLQAFFQSHEVPTFLFKKPAPGIELPHFYVDYGPACRHAVGHLLALGHSHIGLLLDETPTAEHDQIRQSFMEAFQSRRGHAARHRIINYKPSYTKVHQCLAEVFIKSRDEPTALIMLTPSDMMSTLSYFAYTGYRVPADVSVICLGYHPIFQTWKPLISCYTLDENHCYRECAQRILRLAKDGNLPGNYQPEVPEFFAGETVNIAPGS